MNIWHEVRVGRLSQNSERLFELDPAGAGSHVRTRGRMLG
jgi:hypothetical protein